MFRELQDTFWHYSTIENCPVILALIIGIVPAFIWLWFWLREDRINPEPRKLIIFSFIAGLGAVIFSIPLEKMSYVIFAGLPVIFLFIAWSLIEEALKFLWCYVVAIRSRENNEPIDVVMYMIITALGFSAFENTLFLLQPLVDGNILNGLVTGNMRFIGASLLHVLASASIGVFLALSFYKSKKTKIWMGFAGLAVAVTLHTLFNFLIIQGEGARTLFTFSLVWIGIAILLALFEKIKKIQK